MEWWALAAIYFGGLLVLLFLSVPVAVSFLIINLVMIFFFVGEMGKQPFIIVAISSFRSIQSFTFIALPFFIFLGDIIVRSGVVSDAMDALMATLRGGIRGILYYVTIVVTMMFGAVSGSAMACTATMGKMMVADALKRGYSTTMFPSLICTVCCTDILIPPSIIMIVYAGLAGLSAGKMLIGGLIPGIMICLALLVFVGIMVKVRPDTAPAQESYQKHPIGKVLADLAIYGLPLSIIFFAVVLLIYFGIGTPTEAAAGGALAALLLTIAYRKLTWTHLRESVFSTLTTTGMILFIMANSKAFSEILAFTQISVGMTNAFTTLPIPPWVVLLIMQFILFVLGCFMDAVSIIFITVPLFSPVANILGWDPIWFGVLSVAMIALGAATPPFALNIFIMKSIAPPEVTFGHLARGCLAYVSVYLVAFIPIAAFPELILVLPNMMKY